MASLKIFISDDEYADIKKKAEGAGLSVSAYVRTVIKNASPKVQDTGRIDTLLKAMRALVFTQAEALGRTQNASPEAVEKLIKVLLERYDKEAV
jgi:hypothetical protein